MVTGPITATIATVLDLEWYPWLPATWKAAADPSQEDLVPSDLVNPLMPYTAVKFNHQPGISHLRVRYEANKCLETKIWQKAALHYSGQGLEEGLPYLQPAMSAKKQLEKTGLRTQVRALERVVIGAAWTGSRLRHEYDRLAEVYGKGALEIIAAAPSQEVLGDTIHSSNDLFACPRCGAPLETPLHR